MEKKLSLRAKHEAYNEARKLYFAGTYTVTEISEQTSVPRRTLYNWIKEGQWESMREKASKTPIAILDNFIAQLIQVQNKVLSREDGERIPTTFETDIQRKLMSTIADIEQYPSTLFKALSEGIHPISDIVFSAASSGTANEPDNDTLLQKP